jgi:hypothetical protein
MLTLSNKTTISELRGKLGRWVYARNRGGPIRRPWRPQSLPISPAQQTWTDNFKACAARWNSTLTEPQRQAWRAFAQTHTRYDQLHQPYTLTGQNQHASCNAISHYYATTWLDWPPDNLDVTQPDALTITACNFSPAYLSIQIHPQPATNEYWALSAAPQQRPGFNNAARLFRAWIAGAHNYVPAPDLAPAYAAAFRPLIYGKKLFLRYQIANVTHGSISRAITAAAFVA